MFNIHFLDNGKCSCLCVSTLSVHYYTNPTIWLVWKGDKLKSNRDDIVLLNFLPWLAKSSIAAISKDKLTERNSAQYHNQYVLTKTTCRNEVCFALLRQISLWHGQVNQHNVATATSTNFLSFELALGSKPLSICETDLGGLSVL